jgi:hypothetical protein
MPVTYAQIKQDFTRELGRGDAKPSDIVRWLDNAIREAQRELRTPGSESVSEYTVGDTPFTSISVPGDLLGLITISVNGNVLQQAELSKVRRLSRTTGCPAFFAKVGPTYVIGPRPVQGDEIEIVYHANFAALSADTDTNWLIDIASDAVVAGAMVHASIYYRDAQGEATYRNQFANALAALNAQAAADALTNAVISPAYETNFGDD